MPSPNQHPEQIARDAIDAQLRQAGWAVQEKGELDLFAADGVAVKEYQTDTGPADYALFVNQQPVGVIEAKKAEEGFRLSTVEEQTQRYADAEFRYLGKQVLPFLYEANGERIFFTNRDDPHPRARDLFAFPRPQVLAKAKESNLPVR